MDISLEKLLEAGAHFGHQTKRWNPKMAPYIFGVKEGISIFDLVKTKAALQEALDMLSKAASEHKTVLLVGTKNQIKDKLKETALTLELPFVDERWLGGTLTNFDQIKASVKHMQDLSASRDKGEYKEYTKKERLLIDREIEKLERKVGGLTKLTRLPDIMFVIDTHKESSAVREASRMGVEIVGITDSNADPALIDWPIPMNDDAAAALEYVLELLTEAMTAKVKPINPSSPKATKGRRKAKKKSQKAQKKTK